jgi:hypothetical protein
MNEQHNWSEFEASMDAVDRGGGGQQSEAKQKADAFCTAENFAKSPSTLLLSRNAGLALLAVLEEAAATIDLLRDLVGDLGPESDSIEEVILALCDTAEKFSDALDV